MSELKWWQVKPTDRFRRAEDMLEGAPDCFEYPSRCMLAVFVNQTHVANLPYAMISAGGFRFRAPQHLEPPDQAETLSWDEVQP